MASRTVPVRGRALCAIAAASAGLLALAGCGSSDSGGGGSSASSVDYSKMTAQQLYDGAKKEGKLVLYAADTGGDMYPGFEKAYPGIKVQYFQEQGEQSASKMQSEARAGVYNVDVLDTEQNTMYTMSQTGLLAKYTPPEASNVDAKYKNDYWVGYRVQLKPITYNTKEVSGADVPTSLQDLTDPKWTGKICAEPTEVSVFADMVQKLGQDQTVQFWKTLTEHKLRLVSGQTNLVQSVVSGDCPIAVSANLHTVAKSMAKDAPVSWVKTDPLYGNYGAGAVAAKAPHPYAARLYANYLISQAGQATVVKAYRVPVNQTVEPREKELANHSYNALIAGDDVMKNFTKYNDLYYTSTGRPVVGGG
jgi:iron(III) transport system substrate-binding protein